MTPADLDLARRAVACHRWTWMPGMRYVVPRNAPLETVSGRVPDFMRGWTRSPGMLPDLSDPATLGCVMALLDVAYDAWWVEPDASPKMLAASWAVYAWVAPGMRRLAVRVTRIEAIIVALEGAP